MTKLLFWLIVVADLLGDMVYAYENYKKKPEPGKRIVGRLCRKVTVCETICILLGTEMLL